MDSRPLHRADGEHESWRLAVEPQKANATCANVAALNSGIVMQWTRSHCAGWADIAQLAPRVARACAFMSLNHRDDAEIK